MLYLIFGTSYLVPHIPYLIFRTSYCTSYSVPHIPYLILRISYSVPNIPYLIFRTSYLVPHILYLIFGTSYLVPHNRRNIHNRKILKHGATDQPIRGRVWRNNSKMAAPITLTLTTVGRSGYHGNSGQ